MPRPAFKDRSTVMKNPDRVRQMRRLRGFGKVPIQLMALFSLRAKARIRFKRMSGIAIPDPLHRYEIYAASDELQGQERSPLLQ